MRLVLWREEFFYVLVSWLFLELESKEHLANSVGVLSVLEYSMCTVDRTDTTAFQHFHKP